MKCKSCSCPVSSEFKYAFSVNRCPKCGDQMMEKNVQSLFSKMQKVLEEPGTDFGDLAVWVHNEFFKSSDTPSQEMPEETDLMEISKEEDQASPPKNKKAKSPPKPLKRASVKPEEDEVIFKPGKKPETVNPPDRYDSILQDIQLEDEYSGEVEMTDGSMNFDGPPLSTSELMAAASFIEGMPAANPNYNDMQELKRAEAMFNRPQSKVRRS